MTQDERNLIEPRGWARVERDKGVFPGAPVDGDGADGGPDALRGRAPGRGHHPADRTQSNQGLGTDAGAVSRTRAHTPEHLNT
ncbi:MAG: hypothetical protein ACF8PN_04660 [Phycisphaerales bacterium]